MKFNVGDRVRVIGRSTIMHYVPIGHITYISGVPQQNYELFEVVYKNQVIHVNDLILDEDYLLNKKLKEL